MKYLFNQPTNQPTITDSGLTAWGIMAAPPPFQLWGGGGRRGKGEDWRSWPCMHSKPGRLRTQCWGPRPTWAATARPRVRQAVLTLWPPPLPEPAPNPGRGPCLPLGSAGEAKCQLPRSDYLSSSSPRRWSNISSDKTQDRQEPQSLTSDGEGEPSLSRLAANTQELGNCL